MLVPLSLLLVISLVIAWAMMVAYTCWMLTHPPRRGFAFALARGLPPDPGAALGLHATSEGERPWREWTLKSTHRGAPLKVWDVPGRRPDGPTVVITHGWGDSMVVMLTRLRTLAAHASRVVLWDMPGHGESGGVCTLGTSEVDDLVSVIEATGEASVVLYGFSLGGGVSIASAARLGERVRALIAEAPYRVPITPARNVLHLRALPHAMTLGPALLLLGLWRGAGATWAHGRGCAFDRAEHAARLHTTTRLLVLHGDQDVICPIDDARSIAERGRGTLIEVPGGAHQDVWTNPRTRDAAAGAVDRFMCSLDSPDVGHTDRGAGHGS